MQQIYTLKASGADSQILEAYVGHLRLCLDNVIRRRTWNGNARERSTRGMILGIFQPFLEDTSFNPQISNNRWMNCWLEL